MSSNFGFASLLCTLMAIMPPVLHADESWVTGGRSLFTPKSDLIQTVEDAKLGRVNIITKDLFKDEYHKSDVFTWSGDGTNQFRDRVYYWNGVEVGVDLKGLIQILAKVKEAPTGGFLVLQTNAARNRKNHLGSGPMPAAAFSNSFLEELLRVCASRKIMIFEVVSQDEIWMFEGTRPLNPKLD